MERGMLDLHNLVRWYILITGLIVLIKAAGGLNGRKSLDNGTRKAGLFFMIGFDLQLLIGLYLYISKKWFDVFSTPGAMKNPIPRFFGMEHELMMLIALVLVHIGYGSLKKNITDGKKYQRLFWFSLIALILTVAAIPWPGRELIGRPLLPAH